MDNSISQKFSFTSLVKFTIPSIIMMIFTSLYSIVDGVFVARFVNTDALSAVNIAYPFINVLIAIGVMLATGGSAVIAKKLGEQNEEEAKQNFTLITTVGALLGIIISTIGFIFLEEIIYFMGSTQELFPYVKDYLIAILLFCPAFILNIIFGYLSITAGKPNVGLVLTILGGCLNMVLDYVFIVPMDMGIQGAAVATGIGNLVPTIIGLVYFMKVKGSLHFVKPKMDVKVIVDSCLNGSSEMVTNLSTGITTMLFNILMIKYLGSDGVAAMTIVLYGQFLIIAAYIGFSNGVAPIISYNYGDENKEQLRNIIKYSITFIIGSSIVLYILSVVGSPYVVGVFADKASNVYEIAHNGFLIFGISFLVTGGNVFASAMFTAFSNGKISAFISFLRTFVLIIASMMILPKFLGVTGIWLAVPVAEILSIAVSIYLIKKYKSIYGYGKVNGLKDIASN